MAKKKGILGFLGGATRVVFKTASIARGLTGAYYITKNNNSKFMTFIFQ